MADESGVRKAVHRFTQLDEEVAPPTSFAFVHGLGTTEVFVSIRERDGTATRGLNRTVVQDENIVLVTKQDGYPFKNGDSIIVLG